jgi:hypothetical protein
MKNLKRFIGQPFRSITKFSLFLEHHDAIGFQVAHVDFQSRFDDIRVRRQEEPTDVSEKEAALGVVRIRVGLGVFVVDPVIVGPGVGVALRKKKKF